MAIHVAGEQYYDLDGQLAEIKRQLRQPSGYPFDPNQLKVALQDAIDSHRSEVRLYADAVRLLLHRFPIRQAKRILLHPVS